jgi:uncharacterized membrane protein SirB2
MTLFELLKTIHVACALASVAGFTLRGTWVLRDHPLRHHRLTRTLPHAVDTLLLASAVAMLSVWQVSPLALDWVMAKIVALLCYILLGVGLMRFATTTAQRAAYFAGALLSAGYILCVAVTHSPRGPLALLVG